MSFFYTGRSLERQFITAEIHQRDEEGCDVKEISIRVKNALDSQADDAELKLLYLSLIHI